MTFARQDSWKGHTHSKVRSFLCSICGKTFARRNIRDTHERAHLNDRRYPCSFCGKKFMTNQQRTNHERTHTGEKPFQCTDCGKFKNNNIQKNFAAPLAGTIWKIIIYVDNGQNIGRKSNGTSKTRNTHISDDRSFNK